MGSLPTTVSLFCGAGGESLGKHAALESLGIQDKELLSYAVNHWDMAVNAHRRNLPMVMVEKGDITKVNAATYGITNIALLWASPSCVHHSRARGGRPKSDQQRAHAWEVTDRWLKVANVTVVLVENVPEFKDWGPLHETHSSGCKAGVISRFLGLSGRLSGMFPLVKCRKGCQFNSPIKALKGTFFAEWVADLRAQGYEVDHRVINCADLGAGTTRKRFFLQAVKDGKGIHWPEASRRDQKKGSDLFTGHLPTWKTAATSIDWSIPMPSIFMTKQEAKDWGKANGREAPKRPLAPATLARIFSGIDKFVIKSKKPFILNMSHGGRIESLDAPFRTITAGPKGGDRALVVPTLVGVGGRAGQTNPRGLDEPMGTGTTKADTALVAASMISMRGTSPGQLLATAGSVEEPVPTISAGGGHAALVTAFMAKHYTGVTGSDLEAPLGTVTAVDHHSLVAATMIQTGYGERKGQAPRIMDIEQPLGTVVAGGGKHALVAAFMTSFYKAGGTSSPVDDPMRTVTTLARHGLVTVEIDGETWVIVDICMRMLEPHELAAAMSFPPWYKWLKKDGTPLSKRDQVKMIGNAVPPIVAQALVEAVVRPRPELFGRLEWTA